MMKRLFALVLLLSSCAAAQWTTITASAIEDGAGRLLQVGTYCAQGIDANHNVINFTVSGGGSVISAPACVAVVNGAFASAFKLANVTLTNPSGIQYHVTIKNASGGLVGEYWKYQPSGASTNWDTYSEAGAVTIPPTGGTVGGNLAVNGTLTTTGDVTIGGSLLGALNLASVPSAPPASVVFGDSMPAGFEGNLLQGSLPTQLQKYVGQTIVNQGLGGQTSTQVCIRQGGCSTTFATVAGGAIAACTSLPCSGVTVTFPSGRQPIIAQGSPAVLYNFVSGTIQTSPTIHGVVTFSGSIYTFTPDRVGLGATVVGTPTFVVDEPYAKYLQIFWAGRNDILTAGAATVTANFTAMVNHAIANGAPYLCMAINTNNAASEFSGQADYTTIVNENATLSTVCNGHFVDQRAALVSAYNPLLAYEVSDQSRDMPPTTLHAVLGTATLGGNIATATCSTTPIPFTITNGGFVDGGLYVVTIDQEGILVNTIVGGNITACQRAFSGTLASHTSGATMTQYDYSHLNRYGHSVVAAAVASAMQSLATPAQSATSMLSALSGASSNARVTDYKNTAVGDGALQFNVGDGNTALGSGSQASNTSGFQNTSAGADSLNDVVSGFRLSAFGFQSQALMVDGARNLSAGAFSLSTGLHNLDSIALGDLALNKSTGNNNIAIGSGAMANLTTGTGNVANGHLSMAAATTASQVTASGRASCNKLIDGSNNVCDGYFSLFDMQHGTGTTALGYQAGYNSGVALQNQTNNTYIGSGANASADSFTNSTALGAGAQVTGSNQMVLGNGSVTAVSTAGSITAPTFVGALTGNAATATKLATARTIAGTSFDGSANITLPNGFIMKGTSDAGLSGAQFLGSLSTGLAVVTTTTGVVSTVAKPTGAIVGDTDAQTLSSKTLTGASSGNSVTLLNHQASTTSAGFTGNAADQTVYSYTLPANVLAAGKGVRVTFRSTKVAGTNSAVERVKFGGTSMCSNTGGTANSTNVLVCEIWNVTTSTQEGYTSSAITGATQNGVVAHTTGAINTTASVAIIGTVAVTSPDTFNGDGFTVELIQ